MRGTGRLVRLALRRDRISMTVWTVLLGSFPALSHYAYEQFFTPASREVMSASVSRSRALWVVYGRPFDLTSSGGFTAWRVGVLLALVIGLVASFAVVRHTRAEEESGRADALLAGSLSRTAPLWAALIVAALTSLAVSAAAVLGLVVVGAPVGGAVLFGAALASAGCVFAGIGALSSQFFVFSKTANMSASLVIGILFIARGVGDGGSGLGWLVWASPFGWAEYTQPFAGNRWAVLVIPLVAASAVIAVASAISRSRDIGHGLISIERHHETTGRLNGAWPLAAYLQRSSVVAWSIGALAAGAVFGSIAGSLVSLLEADEGTADVIRQMGGSSSVTMAYASAMLTVLGLAAAASGVQGVLHLRAEETDGRLGWVVAAGTTRRTWCFSHLVTATVGSACAMIAGGLGLAVTTAQSADAAPTYWQMAEATAVRLPAVWVIVAAAFFVVAVMPRYNGLVWAGLAFCVTLSMFGDTLRLDRRIMDLSPFQHIPALPGGSFDLTPVLALLALAAVSVGAGIVTFDRRDLVG